MAGGKIIELGTASQSKIIEGVNEIADAIKVTMGPSGKCVAISNAGIGMDPDITRDGATVAKSIEFSDESKNIGARLVRKAASLTESEAGDSTSTTAVMIKELVEKGKKSVSAGFNLNEIKSGMLKAGTWMNSYIKSKSIPVDGDFEKIRKVATISANNDPVIGDLIVESMKQVGVDGVISADLSGELENKIEVTTGMRLDRGWASPQYVTAASEGVCTLEDAYVLSIGEKISSVNQILPLMEKLIPTGKPFLIVCEEMDENVNSTLVLNTLQGAIRTCVVRGIDFGDARKNLMEDLAVAVGGVYVCKENGVELKDATLSVCGHASKIVVTRDSCTIFEGSGDPDEINARASILKARINDPKVTPYDKTKFEKRVANLIGGISIIKAGGATETEKLNRKATIEDAILASKCAISEGCVPGSGYIYLKGSVDAEKDKDFWKSLQGDEVEGAKIVFSSLPVIMKTVVSNCGESSDVVLDNVKSSKKDYYGFNAKTKTYGNLLEEGVLDSTKSIRVALENAISTASMILLIDCSVTFEPEKNSILDSMFKK